MMAFAGLTPPLRIYCSSARDVENWPGTPERPRGISDSWSTFWIFRRRGTPNPTPRPSSASRSAFGKRIKSEALGGSKAKALTESGTLELSMLSWTWLQLFKAQSENANGSVLSIQKRLWKIDKNRWNNCAVGSAPDQIHLRRWKTSISLLETLKTLLNKWTMQNNKPFSTIGDSLWNSGCLASRWLESSYSG
jgi:hypothetical protein